MSIPSDLEIARSVTPRPIVDVAGSSASATTSSSCTGRPRRRSGWRRSPGSSRDPRGKYVVVTAITPTPLGEGKSTTTVGLAQGLNRIGRKAAVASASRHSARCSGSRAAPPVAATARSSRWRTSTST